MLLQRVLMVYYDLFLWLKAIFLIYFYCTQSTVLSTNINSNENILWNLKGKPGDGYYIAVEIGTPPQQVRIIFYLC